jgi:hypothetical protein
MTCGLRTIMVKQAKWKLLELPILRKTLSQINTAFLEGLKISATIKDSKKCMGW